MVPHACCGFGVSLPLLGSGDDPVLGAGGEGIYDKVNKKSQQQNERRSGVSNLCWVSCVTQQEWVLPSGEGLDEQAALEKCQK